jgi:hypothetical protein
MDTVKENVTGVFFDKQTAEGLIKAMENFEALEGSFKQRDQFTEQVKPFSRDTFKKNIMSILEEHKRV